MPFPATTGRDEDGPEEAGAVMETPPEGRDLLFIAISKPEFTVDDVKISSPSQDVEKYPKGCGNCLLLILEYPFSSSWGGDAT